VAWRERPRSDAAAGAERVDGGQEGLGGQVLGHRRLLAARGQVPEDVRESVVVEGQER
jgi:hypothetical protein